MKLWNWINGHKTQIAVVLSVVLSVLGRRGIEVPPWVFDVTDGILGLGLAHKAVKVLPKKAAAAAAVLALAALVLPACQGLASALGQTPTATAPVFNGIGINALPGSEVWIDGANPDNSGAVGASGTASQENEQRQVTQIDPGAVAKGIADIAEVVLPTGKAAAMLGKAQEALEAGDVAKAETLRKAAKGLAEREAKKAAEEVVTPPVDPAPTPAPVQ